MAVPIEADDLAELILTDDEANDEPWDSFVFFTYFGDRRTEESGFQYFETKWRPALVGSMELGSDCRIYEKLRASGMAERGMRQLSQLIEHRGVAACLCFTATMLSSGTLPRRLRKRSQSVAFN